MAFFDARLQNTPVRGAIMVQLDDGGGGTVAVVFDRPADITRSFKPMARQLAGAPGPGGGPASRSAPRQQHTTPDGKASIGVPAGWRISGWGNGAVDLAGPQGGGRPHLHFALVNTAIIDQRSWAYYYSTVGAPDGIFQRDFATMLNVWRSWSLNQHMLRDRT